MVVSINNKASEDEFKELLDSLQNVLDVDSKKAPDKYIKLAGRNIENYIEGILKELSVGTPFQDSIFCISGQKFPDIIAKEYYGIEVKTTLGNHWRTTGNSVFEGTRIPSVERIYLLFGKLFSPVEFKIKPYEECLSEIVVTHSPRYLIDMNLQSGETIFDKLNISYDNLRKNENAIQPITEYYKKQLKPGESLWWIDSSNSVNIKIRLWSTLSIMEKEKLKIEILAYFPEIFGNSQSKFNAVTFFLLNRHAIIHPNVRDTFSAGGQVYIEPIKTDIPRIIFKAWKCLDEIKGVIDQSPTSSLKEFWKVNVERDKYGTWKQLLLNLVNPKERTIIDKLF